MKFCAPARKRVAFGVLDQFGNVEGLRAGLQIQRDETDQRDQRAKLKYSVIWKVA